jgi:hypothetical protein
VAPGNKLIGAVSPSSVGKLSSLITKYPTLKVGTATKTVDYLCYMSGTSTAAPIGRSGGDDA